MRMIAAVCLCAILPAADGAAMELPLVELDYDVPYYQVTRVEYLEDKEGALAIEDIIALADSGGFTISNEDVNNFGFTSSVYWLRFAVRADGSAPEKQWMLELGYPLIDDVELYFLHADGRLDIRKSGDRRPFSSREIWHRHFVWKIPDVDQSVKTMYMRVKSKGSVRLPLSIWESAYFYRADSKEQVIFGLFYGIHLALVLYNLFLFISVRDTSYLYYSLYLANLTLLLASMTGFSAQYLWPEAYNWANIAVPFFAGLGVYFGVWFTRRFAQSNVYAPGMDMVMSIISYSGLVLIGLLLFIDYSIAVKIATSMGVIILHAIFITIVWSYVRGFRPALYALFSFIPVFIFIFLAILNNIGAVPDSFYPEYGSNIGIALSSLVLSFGLANRINMLDEEKKKAQLSAWKTERRLSLELINAQEKERKRIAAELHDSIGQTMLVIRGKILSVLKAGQSNSNDNETLESASELASQSVTEVREISHNLHPHMLERLGLAKAVESYTQHALETASIDYSINIEPLDNIVQTSNEIHIYRIIQEGINNIVKHSGAAHARVEILNSGNAVENFYRRMMVQGITRMLSRYRQLNRGWVCTV